MSTITHSCTIFIVNSLTLLRTDLSILLHCPAIQRKRCVPYWHYNPQNILNITVPYGNVWTNTHALTDWYGSVYTAPITASSTHIQLTSPLHAWPLLYPFENICRRTDQYIYKVEKLLHKSNPPGIRNNKLHVLRISLQYYLRSFQISRNEEKFYIFHIFG